MSEWQVALSFSEGSSNKFWRARTDGSTLYVNFGRIGSDGQTQIKEFPSDDAAGKELAKLEREKRKKGYGDMDAAGGKAGDEDEAEAEADDGDSDDEEEAPKAKAAPAAVAPAPGRRVGAAALVPRPSAAEHADFALEAEGRKIELRLTLDGSAVRTIVVDRYPNAAEAQAEFSKLKEQMVADGYKKVPTRDTL